MAGVGYKTWSAGDVLAAAEVNTYLMDQSVMVFDDSAARASAIAAPTEGMLSYLKDTNAVEYYDGSAWTGVSNPGDITAVTAGTALTGGGSSGDVTLDVNLVALATAVVGTALTADSGTLNVDLSAVGSAISIDATQVSRTITTSTATAYDVLTADANTTLRFTNGVAGTVTFGTGTAFSVGDAVDILMDGAGTVTVAASGVNVYGRGTAGNSYNIGQRYDAVSVICVAADDYRIIGNAEAV